MYKNLVARRACALAVTSFFFSFPFSAQAQTAPVAPPVKAAFVYVAPLTDAGWVRQQENQQLGLPLELVATFPPRLQELCGFGIYRGLVGHIVRRSPAEALLGASPAPLVWDRVPAPAPGPAAT